MGQEGNVNYGSSNAMPRVRRDTVDRYLIAPALGTATAVLPATQSVAASVVTNGITNPDHVRNLTATPGGTTGNVLAVSVVVTGTNIEDAVITETLPAFTAGASTAVTGSKAFKTVTSISLPANGAATTISIGTGAKIGLNRRLGFNTVHFAALNGTREATAPTVATDAVNIEGNTASLNSALNGTNVHIVFADIELV